MKKPFETWPPPGGRRQRVRAVKDGESCSLAEGQQARLPTLQWFLGGLPKTLVEHLCFPQVSNVFLAYLPTFYLHLVDFLW